MHRHWQKTLLSSDELTLLSSPKDNYIYVHASVRRCRRRYTNETRLKVYLDQRLTSILFTLKPVRQITIKDVNL
jgi:hypothetical protein